LGEKAALKGASYLGRPNITAGTSRSYVETAWGNTRNHGILGGSYRNLKQFSYRRKSQKLTELLGPAARGFAEDITTTFARYEVNLNFSNVWADGRPGSKLIPHVRLRDFEAPMCGTCYLTGYTDEIAEFYELEQEILTYRNAEELVHKRSTIWSIPRQPSGCGKRVTTGQFAITRGCKDSSSFFRGRIGEMKRLLVTGSSGLIGSEVVSFFAGTGGKSTA